MTLKIVVLSDLHIVREGEATHTLDTAERLARGVAAINARHADADFCVLAGDLADLGEAEAYVRLQSILSELTVPCHITLGNHDNRPVFLEVFGKDYEAETGCIDKVIDHKGYRTILLDSSEPGIHPGVLTDAQYDWLEERLLEAADKPVIVILHHHANPLFTRVDRIILRDGARLANLLAKHGDIRQVIAGHVHYNSTALWRGIPFTTLSGNHYNVTVNLDGGTFEELDGPAQMAVILADADQTLVHFDNYIDSSAVIVTR